MTPAQLSDALLLAVRELSLGDADVPLRHRSGRWTTGVARRLAGPAGRPADEVARALGERVGRLPGVRGVEVADGFLSVALDERADAELVAEIVAREPAPAPPEDTARDAARWAAAAGGDPAGALLVQRDANPLFRVRYAHARTRSLLRGGAALGIRPEPGPAAGPADRALLGLLGERPPARPARLAGWLVRVADAFGAAERERPVLPVGDEKPGAAHRARLAVAQATGTVLAGGLARLGISAPDHL